MKYLFPIRAPLKISIAMILFVIKSNLKRVKHTEEKILNANLVIKSPGIPEKAEIIKKIKAKGIEMIDEIEFGFRYIQWKSNRYHWNQRQDTTTTP
jgi:UDP-N-acetylmuramoylalanine-D-glutamate ligase